MKTAKQFIIFTLFALTFTISNGQKNLIDANKLYARLAYAEAIPKYRNIVTSDPSSIEAKIKLADCYRLTGNYHEAEKWYEQIAGDNKATDLDRFHYGQMLMNNGKYEEAKKWLAISKKERPHDERAENLLNAIDKMQSLFADSVNYTITQFAGNGSGNDFSPVFYNDGIVFTSSQPNMPKQKTHTWTGESFTKLYYTSNNATGQFAKEVQTKLNNGPVSFSLANEMFFTINVIKVENSKKDVYKLNIVHSTYNGKTWSKPESFTFNSPNYNAAHPAVTSDGKRLYFASDMPGGEGGMDLYYVDRKAEGWSEPINLGKEVNTPGNEIFPCVHADGTLYFASNGHEGIGGLDVFATTFSTPWQKPIALPFPVNTRYDDFGFIIDSKKTSGYFSSNRPKGKGGDDIYKFNFTPSLLKGNVLNGDTKQILPNSSVTIRDKNSGRTITATSDQLGHFESEVSPCRNYEITTTHEAFASPVVMEVKTNCTTVEAGKLEILFSNPKIKFEITDKYTSANILDVSLELFDGESKKLIVSGKASELNPAIEPCREYYMITRKQNMPDVKTWYKSTCTAKDEIVKISMGTPPLDPLFIGGVVVDQESKKPLDSVALIIYGPNNQPLATITSTSDGNFGTTGFKNVERIVFFRNGYFSVTKVMANQSSKRNITIEMPGLQLDRIIQLEGIFYDLGKFNIRPDAARILDNVVKVMMENPTLSIELGAHTDSRGNDNSNMTLSDKRAKAAAQYIVDKGIEASRVNGKGYGESVLKNRCLNGIKCSEKQHQENRRTEVKVTSY